MPGEKASDALAAARYAKFDSEIERHAADINKQHGAKQGVVEKIIRAHGYEPEALAKMVASSGLIGSLATGDSPDPIAATLREIFAAVAKELGVELEKDI